MYEKSAAPGRGRIYDFLLRKQTLHPLSYKRRLQHSRGQDPSVSENKFGDGLLPLTAIGSSAHMEELPVRSSPLRGAAELRNLHITHLGLFTAHYNACLQHIFLELAASQSNPQVAKKGPWIHGCHHPCWVFLAKEDHTHC